MAEQKPTLASRLFAGGGSAGLLGDPLFRVGMGLLAKGQDNRIPYATAVMQGLQGAQTARDEANRRQMLAEQARREKMKREAYEKAIAQLYPNMPGQMAAQPVPSQVTPGMNMQMMGPPTPPTQNPVASLLSAVGPEAGSAALLSGLLANTNDSGFADIQAPSPKDFTPESLRAYQLSKDPSVLVRLPLTRILTNKDGTQSLLDFSDPDNPQIIPITTPQDVTNRAREFERIARSDPEYKASVSSLVDVANDLLSADLSNVLGAFDSRSPTIRERSAGLEAKLDLIQANLELFNTGRLKGQGQVSEGEREILRRATTMLSNRSISEAEAKLALSDIVRVLEGKLNPEDRQSNKRRAQGSEGRVLVTGSDE